MCQKKTITPKQTFDRLSLMFSCTGQYIYFETSSPARNKDKAAIASPDMAVRRACLSFYYHMYGAHIGSLKVVRVNAKGRRILWARHTNQGDRWLNAQIDIKESNLYNVSWEGVQMVENM